VNGQNIDSLRLRYEGATDPVDIAQLGLILGKSYLYKNQDSAAFYFEVAKKVLPEEGNDSLYILLYERSSALEEFKGNNAEAISLVYKALDRIKQSGRNEFLDKIYMLLGRYHMRATRYDSAVYFWNLLLQKYEDEGLKYDMWLPYHLLAEMNKNLGDWPKSKEYFTKSLECVRLQKFPKDYLFLLYNYMLACDVEGELDLYSQLKDEYLSFKHEQGLDILGSEHSTMKRINDSPDDRLKRLTKYLPYHIKNKSNFSICDTYYRLGEIYMQEKKYDEAILSFNSMLASIDSLDLPFLKFAGHTALYTAYVIKNDYKTALYHYRARYTLHDTLLHIEKQKQMNELMVKYETSEKEKQLAETTLHLQSSKKNQQFLGFGMFVALVISGLIYYTLRTKLRLNRQLEEKNKVITHALEEKDILLREIHHRVKNNLQMISALLYLHGKSLDDSSAQVALMESQNRVQSMAIIHQNLYQNENLLGVGVKEYLDKLIHHLTDSYNIEKDRIAVHKNIEVDYLDVDTIIPLALIINELISNALKYAFKDGRQGIIDVFLGSVNGQFILEVKDDGIGLPFKESSAPQGNFGFKLINILADRLGATFQARTDQGTVVTLLFPFSNVA
jgi:two-component sensor histidine kinase